MGDGNERRSTNEVNSLSTNCTSSSKKAMSSLSLEISKYPRDLLERFNLYSGPSGAHLEEEGDEEEEDEEEGNEGIELALGLSLGGRFGVEKSSYSSGAYSFFKRKRKKLTRSSSIAGSIPLPRDEDGFLFGGVGTSKAALAEKVAAVVGGAGGSQHRSSTLLRTSSLPVETEEEWRKRKELQSLRRKEAKRRRSQKQQRGGSRTPELERSGGETSGSANAQSLQDRINQVTADSSVTRTSENPIRTSGAEVDNQSNRGRENTSNSAEDMPCVFTKGDGPNGRRVDGILYRFRRGEGVRIMCICHGLFHTPAEFVKHAGGRDVDNPLRHIVMNPSGPSF